MADRICPFCGKTNPEDAEVCQHCQARLISSSNPLPKSPDEAKQELSDWLNSTREDAAKSAGLPDVPSQAAADGAPQEEAPEWLARIRERSRAEQEGARTAGNIFESPEPPAQQAKESRSSKKAKADELKKEKPEETWLEELRDEKETTGGGEPAKADLSAGDVPPAESEDWVKKLDGWQDSPEAYPGGVKEEPVAPVKPFHSSDIEENPEPQTPRPAPTKKQPGKKENTDQSWLEKTRQDAQKSEPPASVPSEEPIPDWLEELETSFPPPEPTKKKGVDKTKTGSGAPPVKTPPEGTIPTGSEEMPDWLKNIRPGASKKSKPSAPAFIPGHDVEPITPSQPLEEPSSEKPADVEGLAPAQLPSWLQAMRPVESVLPESLPRGETSGEKGSGALAGLADVIPIQDEATPVSKTSDSTPRLRVDDRQKVQAQLLESVLVEGNKAVEIPKSVQKKGRSAGRILISLLTIVFLAIPIVLGSNSRLMPSPVFFAPETVSMFTAMQTLAANSRVLVVLDYQPSLSGELQTASLPVIEHLMAKNSGLVFISTTPSGPILANTLAQLAQNATPGFDADDFVVNLGYLAGGAIGLQEFVQQPRYTVPITWDRLDAWSNPVLQGITGLKDFNAVVILTESADTAKIWIEQVLPTIPQVSTYLVTSQQSSALLLPYYNSAQLKGMVSGISGSKMYEMLLSKPGAAQFLWDSYQIGVILLLVVILFGGIFSSIPSRQKTTAPGAKDETL